MSLQSGVRLGPYEIVSLAGAGGMGEVYRARDTRLGRSVAIKVIGSGYGNYPEMRRRFDTEARLVAQLDHPRIGALFDVGHDDGIDYVVMEFIEGKTLAERIIQGPLAFAELIGYAIEIAAGLAYAHARGIEHRDLKPGNILLTATGVKIIDFGIGKLRQSDLAWMGRDGRRLGSAAGPAQYVDFQLSPNNRYIAVGQADQHSDRSDLRLIDLLRGSNLRLTTSPAMMRHPFGHRMVRA